MPSAEELIALLGLKAHPTEGGWFRETFRSADTLPATALPASYRTERHVSTAIYYLLTPTAFSALHRLPTEEVFHFYLGSPVTMLQLAKEGGRVVTLGPDVQAGQHLQLVVPRGVWQGSFLASGAFALLGCTVAPGFDFADYEAGSGEKLSALYPEFADLIRRLTPRP